MQQLFLIGKKKLEWREIPDARIETPTDVVVRPLAIARCDLEPPMIDRGFILSRPPIPLGHEFTGVILEVGDAVKNFRPGDQVAAPFEISCGECRPCRKGHSPGCTALGSHPAYGLGRGTDFTAGALAERIRVPYADHMLVRLPDNVDPIHIASLSDNIVEGWRAVGPDLTRDPNQTVLILGGGARSIGLYTAATAKALGATDVVYLDTDRERLQIAEAIGVTVREVGPPWPKSLGEYDLVTDAGSTQESLLCAISSAAHGGTVTSTSVFFSDQSRFPLKTLYDRSINFRGGWVHSREMMSEPLKLITDGRMAPELVTSLVADFSDAAEVWREDTTKVIVRGPRG